MPGWLAVMEHVPMATSVTVTPETVQTEGLLEASVTARPELAVAVRVGGVELSVTAPNAPNVIVCGASAETTNVWVTGVAGA